jgi:hypothetical protein
MSQDNWNPKQPNIRVRMKNNPGKQGLTTGNVVDFVFNFLVLLTIQVSLLKVNTMKI